MSDMNTTKSIAETNKISVMIDEIIRDVKYMYMKENEFDEFMLRVLAEIYNNTVSIPLS
jgi:CII-binding regulator of phage lambda lysogenization HflD